MSPVIRCTRVRHPPGRLPSLAPRRPRRRARRRDGKIAITTALLLPVLLGFAALAIDRGMLQVRDEEAQAAADAVAHAAANQLDGSDEGLTAARSAARTVAGQNRVGLVPVGVDGPGGAQATVELGRWRDGRFVADQHDPRDVSAARARVTRLDIPTILGAPAFGVRHLQVEGLAIAIAGGAGTVECPLPLAVPDCAIPDTPGMCDADLVLNADGDDTVGWALIGGQRPSASTIRAAIDACAYGDVDTDAVVTLNNGAVTGATQALARALDDSTDEWDVDELGELPAQSARSGVLRYGNVIDSWMIVFHDASECADTSYTATALPVDGFVRTIVYDVDTTGPIETRAIRARLGCSYEPAVVGGGGHFGTTAPPRLVSETP